MHERLREAARRYAKPVIAQGYKPEGLHCYTNPRGRPLHWRIRLKHPETGDKWIRPMFHNGTGFELAEPKYPNGKPLYALRQITRNPEAMIWVVEGEQKADVLNKLGLVATTSGSATSESGTDWEPLRGRVCRIWPDNDDPGKSYAGEVATILLGMGCTVSCVDVDKLGLSTSDDVVDWLKLHENATGSDIEALPILTPQSTTGSAADSDSVSLRGAADKEIERLASIPVLEYERLRKTEAEALGIRASVLDKLVSALRKSGNDDGMGMVDVDPWPAPIEPVSLLTDISATVKRFIVCNPETADAVALWAAMTWFMDVVKVAPLAVITAPEKRCGKSQLLFLLGKLSHRPLSASNISASALFRSIDAWKPTLLIDEADAFMRDNEELRGLLNCGHERDSAYIIRTVGENFTPTRFNVWGAKALAGIGHLADTIMDRSVTLELRRKLPHESVDRLRHAEPDLFAELSEKLARFAEDYQDAVRHARPEIPASLNDRAQDNWEPLLAIADVAGGEWPKLARQAAFKLSGVDSPTMTVGTELLSDIQEIFDTKGQDRISTADLITALCSDDEKTWATYNRGKQISPRQVARKLGEYGISSQTIRIGHSTAKGFLREWFDEAFSRYLALPPFASVTTSQPSPDAALRVTDSFFRYGNKLEKVTPNPALHKACDGVTDRTPKDRHDEIVEVEF